MGPQIYIDWHGQPDSDRGFVVADKWRVRGSNAGADSARPSRGQAPSSPSSRHFAATGSAAYLKHLPVSSHFLLPPSRAVWYVCTSLYTGLYADLC